MRLTENATYVEVVEACIKHGVPTYMATGLYNYFVHRVPPGDFLQAVLTNDLKQAVGLADDHNVHCLPFYIRLLRAEASPGSWGSEDRLIQWLEGRQDREQKLEQVQEPTERELEADAIREFGGTRLP